MEQVKKVGSTGPSQDVSENIGPGKFNVHSKKPTVSSDTDSHALPKLGSLVQATTAVLDGNPPVKPKQLDGSRDEMLMLTDIHDVAEVQEAPKPVNPVNKALDDTLKKFKIGDENSFTHALFSPDRAERFYSYAKSEKSSDQVDCALAMEKTLRTIANAAPPMTKDQALKLIQTEVVDKYIGEDCSKGMFNIGSQHSNPVLEALGKKDLPALITSLGEAFDAGKQMIENDIFHRFKGAEPKLIAIEKLTAEIQNLPLDKKIAFLEKVEKGTDKFENKGVDLEAVNIKKMATKLITELKSEAIDNAISPLLTGISEGRNQIKALNAIIKSPMVIPGIDKSEIIEMAKSLRTSQVDKITRDMPIEKPQDMEAFITNFNAATRKNSFFATFNPDMKKVNAALENLQKICKDSPGDTIAQYDAFVKVQEAAKVFVDNDNAKALKNPAKGHSTKFELVESLLDDMKFSMTKQPPVYREVTASRALVKSVFSEPKVPNVNAVESIMADPLQMKFLAGYCKFQDDKVKAEGSQAPANTQNLVSFMSDLKTAMGDGKKPIVKQDLQNLFDKYIKADDGKSLGLSPQLVADLKSDLQNNKMEKFIKDLAKAGGEVKTKINTEIMPKYLKDERAQDERIGAVNINLAGNGAFTDELQPKTYAQFQESLKVKPKSQDEIDIDERLKRHKLM